MSFLNHLSYSLNLGWKFFEAVLEINSFFFFKLNCCSWRRWWMKTHGMNWKIYQRMKVNFDTIITGRDFAFSLSISFFFFFPWAISTHQFINNIPACYWTMKIFINNSLLFFISFSFMMSLMLCLKELYMFLFRSSIGMSGLTCRTESYKVTWPSSLRGDVSVLWH